MALLGAGCLRGAGTRCERVCRQEAECAELMDVPESDVTGCIESCSDLERDTHTQRLVEDHLRCVSQAGTCEKILECP